MPKITAIIHANNDELRIGRALESLRLCDEVVVIDHGSNDKTADVAREHGAMVKIGVPGVEAGVYIHDARHDWILCLQPNEALTEALEAALHEWKNTDSLDTVGYCINVREETENGWQSLPAELRLVNRNFINWPDRLPPANCEAPLLPGELLRFAKP
jgi:glycosyltransferase involved in cell wall biosynthesis